MVCRYCRKKIGLLRKLKDPHFCCDDHRKKLTSKSARAVREAEDLYGFDDTQLPTWRVITQVKREEKSGKGLSTTVFAGWRWCSCCWLCRSCPWAPRPRKLSRRCRMPILIQPKADSDRCWATYFRVRAPARCAKISGPASQTGKASSPSAQTGPSKAAKCTPRRCGSGNHPPPCPITRWNSWDRSSARASTGRFALPMSRTITPPS